MGLVLRVATLAWVAAVGTVACSGSKSRSDEDATRTTARGDAVPGDAARAAPADAAPTGDVHVRVEWVGVPATARSSPGKTACGTPRSAAVEPTTTWGIPDAVVLIEGAVPPPEARLRLEGCTWKPRIAVGGTLVVDSTADRPTSLTVRQVGRASDLRASDPGAPRSIRLPIAGHVVTAELDGGTLYEVRTEAKLPEVAWIVTAPGVVTDAHGVASFRDLAAGERRVQAWLPARAGQPARYGDGTVTVEAGDLVEVTLRLAP